MTNETKVVYGITLHRIKAVRDFGSVQAGDLGGWIEKEENLSHEGQCWVFDEACVSGDAEVSGDACVYGNADIFWASKVGRENGTITVCKSTHGLVVTRGGFIGTDIEFLEKVGTVHGADSKIGREYHMLIEVARSRILG